ncbi:hypothetical protein B4100_3737 [Heyndrickxia coagulans]|nr:hypothetical protein B4100_3737 [Heyndrickxia coagulans]
MYILLPLLSNKSMPPVEAIKAECSKQAVPQQAVRPLCLYVNKGGG